MKPFGNLIFLAATVNLLGAASSVHVPRSAADEGFVGFERTGHLIDGSVVHGVATVPHDQGK